MRRKEIRVQTLVLVAAVTGIIGFAIFAVITRSGTLVPKPSLLSGVLLVVMGGLVLWLARPVRRYLQGRATTSLDPLRAARTVVLAQAAALTGSAPTNRADPHDPVHRSGRKAGAARFREAFPAALGTVLD